MLSFKTFGDWMMPRAPDMEALLARAFKGTGALQGGGGDYALALAIACAFPVMRLVMDRLAYAVGGREGPWAVDTALSFALQFCFGETACRRHRHECQPPCARPPLCSRLRAGQWGCRRGTPRRPTRG